MTDSEDESEHVKAALAAVEMTHTIVSLLDGIKTGLDERGWPPVSAAHAATTLGNTVLIAMASAPEKKRKRL